ncbi:hypothetical protein ACFVW9_15140 [Streptomyces sp. NPDC058217]|uniref:TRADD-N-associated membrane domain-containing protein n=1 Tax=Streptomyces sp. NPDC058217 TaxID=3346384 RepID=UPI0036E46226
MQDLITPVLGAASALVGAFVAAFGSLFAQRSFDRQRQSIATTLRDKVLGDGGSTHINLEGGTLHLGGGLESPDDALHERPLAARQRIDDDRFAELLVQRYAYGLTQSQRSFLTSQVFSVLGGLVLLTGVGLAIWRAETSGDLYASIVTTSAGIVTTIIGRLFHRESDKALKHMASETDALRDDMRSERSAEQAILLLEGVLDPEVKARLQAGLIMRFAGSDLPSLHDTPRVPKARADADAPNSAER